MFATPAFAQTAGAAAQPDGILPMIVSFAPLLLVFVVFYFLILRPQQARAKAQAALGAWHLNAVVSLGTLMARGALGARKADGLESLDRAIALGGERALFPALEGMLRLAIDGTDAGAAALLARAAICTSCARLF